MKKFLLAFGILFSGFCLFAADGFLWGAKDIRVTRTQWFDIIYAAESEASARLLYENADRIYEEIAAQYGHEIVYRLPVVITSRFELFNAYFSTGYYNHIVLFDAPVVEDLDVFSQTFLSTFRHELTHAYTTNLKNKFWQTVGNVLGDAVNPVYLSVTRGWMEAAAVTAESSDGEGRLNDEFARQMVKQAKIEDEFPGYNDQKGAADVYPTGSFYYFNAAFNDYLQKTYGMEKYARFWYRLVNFQKWFVATAFREVYGMSVNEAWEDFRAAYEVPEIPANPVEAGIARDFFEPEKDGYSVRNREGARFSSLTASKKRLTYIDDATDAVYSVTLEQLASGRKIRPKKLLTRQSVFSARQSADGRFLAVNHYYPAANYKILTKVYDFDRRSWLSVPGTGLTGSSVIRRDGDYFLVSAAYHDQTYSLVVQKLEAGKRITGVSDYARIDFPQDVHISDFTDLGNGTFAYIKKTGLSYAIVISDADGTVLQEFSASEERMMLRYLSATEDRLLFSWTRPGTMPRLGSAELSGGTLELSRQDISGGVYSPVSDAAGGVVYIGQFFRENRLLRLPPAVADEERTRLTAAAPNRPASEPAAAQEPLESEKYRMLGYYRRGLFLPISQINSVSYMPGETASYSMPYGVTYVSSNPWDSDTILLSAGYGNATNSFGLAAQFSGGTSIYTSLLKYTLSGMGEFDFDGWKAVLAQETLSSYLPFGAVSAMQLELVNITRFGRVNKYNASISLEEDSVSSDAEHLSDLFAPFFGYAKSEDKNNYLFVGNQASLAYSNVHYSGDGTYEKAGLTVGGGLYYFYEGKMTGAYRELMNDMDLGLFAKVYIPKLLPVRCIDTMTYNLPTRLEARLFPYDLGSVFGGDTVLLSTLDSYSGKNILASVRGETVLFGKEIQKSTFIPAVFAYDLKVSLAYTGIFIENYNNALERQFSSWRFAHADAYRTEMENNQILYEGYLAIRTTMGLGPNVGFFANSAYRMNLFAEFSVGLIDGIPLPMLCSLGIETSF